MSGIESFFLRAQPKNISKLNSFGSHRNEVTIESNLKIELVIENQLAPPVSYKGYFYDFIKAESGPRQLEFLKEIIEYYKNSCEIFEDIRTGLNDSKLGYTDIQAVSAGLRTEFATVPDGEELMNKLPSPKKPQNWSDEKYSMTLEARKADRDRIIHTFAFASSVFSVNLPEKHQNLLQKVLDSDILHPNTFCFSWDLIKRSIEKHFFRKFLKEATIKAISKLNADIPKVTINQLVENSLCSPFSFEDYYEFLKQAQSEENLEFLAIVSEYQQDAISIFPAAILPKSTAIGAPVDRYSVRPETEVIDGPELIPSNTKNWSNNDFQNIQSSLRAKLNFIIERYVVPDSPKEVNLAVNLRKPLLAKVENGIFHPDIFNHAYEHISEMLNMDGLQKFIKERVEVSKLRASLEHSAPNITLHQVIMDEVGPPFTKEDFRKFLLLSYQERRFDFLIEVIDYEKACEGYFNFEQDSSVPAPSRRISKAGYIDAGMPVNFKITDPICPPKMSKNDFDAKVDELKAKATEICLKFVDSNGKKHLKMRAEIQRSIMSFLNNNKFHPAIFLSLKALVVESLEKKHFREFLMKKNEEKLKKGLTLKLESGFKTNIDKILLDELPFPFIFEDFVKYCESVGIMEGVHFSRAIMNYQKKASILFLSESTKKAKTKTSARATSARPRTNTHTKLSSSTFGDSLPNLSEPIKPSNMSNETYDVLLKEINEQYEKIFQLFILPEAPMNVNLLPSIYKPLIDDYTAKKINPDIFTVAYDYFASNLEKTVWEGYKQTHAIIETKATDSNLPRISIRQLINNELPFPFSYDDFLQHLKREMCDESGEFLKLCLKYELLTTSLFPVTEDKQENSLTPIRSPHMTEKEFENRVNEAKILIAEIINNYIKPGSPREVHVSVSIRKSLFEQIANGALNPKILRPAVNMVSDVLRLNQLSKFLSKAAEKQDTRPTKSQVGRAQATMKQIILNELPPPFSLQDFKNFAKTEHVDDSLQFLLAVVDYHKFASPLYSTSLESAVDSPTKINRTSVISVSNNRIPIKEKNMSEAEFIDKLAKTKTLCQMLIDDFFTPGSEKEVNVGDKEKKKLMADFSSGNYNPDIFKPVFEHIANLLRTNCLNKFLNK